MHIIRDKALLNLSASPLRSFGGATAGRRDVIVRMAKAAGAAIVLNTPFAGNASTGADATKKITVGEIMDAFTSEVSGAPFANTVDTLKAGSGDIEVRGIITSMFATLELINKAIAMKANFIIAHEPTYYNHLDETNWLENDEVFRYKSSC